MQFYEVVYFADQALGVLLRVLGKPLVPLATRVIKLKVIHIKTSVFRYSHKHIEVPSTVVVISVAPLLDSFRLKLDLFSNNRKS